MRRPIRFATPLLAVLLAACGGSGPPAPTPGQTHASTVATTPATTSLATLESTARTPGPALAYRSFTVGADTGDVPPPFNYTYTIEGTFQPEVLSIHYVLTYQYRDQITPAEITSQGYTLHDDIDWTTKLSGQALETWRGIVAATTLGPIPPLVPGAASFSVTLTPPTGEPQVGVPVNRDAWQAAITALDVQARAATGAKRTEP